MNQHARDNLNALRVDLLGRSILAEYKNPITVDGANRVVTHNADDPGGAIDWESMAAQGVVQWRMIGGVFISALNGATLITLNGRVWREYSKNVQGAAYMTVMSAALTVSTGWKTFDTGWGSATSPPAGDGHGIYRLGYSVDYATAAPGMGNLSMALMVRVL